MAKVLKQPSKKCGTCMYRNYPMAMNRLYIKRGREMVPVGWLCKKCGAYTIEHAAITNL
jgi:hypothetical protein